MGWNDYPLTSLTLPAGAGDDDPRIVLNGEPPAIIVAYYAALGATVTGFVGYYTSADRYAYYAVISDGGPEMGLVEGLVSGTTVNDVKETTRHVYAPALGIDPPEVRFGNVETVEVRLGTGFGNAVLIASAPSNPGDPKSGIELQRSINGWSTFSADGFELSRGFKFINDTVTVVNIGVVATVVRTSSAECLNGRRYEVRFLGRYKSNVAGATLTMRVRHGTLATDPVIRDMGEYICSATVNTYRAFDATATYVHSSSNFTESFCLEAIRTSLGGSIPDVEVYSATIMDMSDM